MPTPEPYPLYERFAQTVAYLCSTDHRFWSKIGHAIEPERVEHVPSRHVLEACRALAAEAGRGPADTVAVIQRLLRWQREGRRTAEDVEAVITTYEDVEDRGGVSDPDGIANELVPLVRLRANEAMIPDMLKLARKGELGTLVDKIQKAESLGESSEEPTISMGASAAAEMVRYRGASRLSTRLVEMDVRLEGGPPCGSLGVAIAPSGAGKSMYLAEQLQGVVSDGEYGLYATLELSPRQVHGRMLAGLTGLGVTAVAELPEAKLERLFDQVQERTNGMYEVRAFTPKLATIDDVKSWVFDRADRAGRMPRLVVVDYGDRVADKRSSDTDSYRTGEFVFEGMCMAAEEQENWWWTASQSTRNKDKRKRVDLDHVADSMHKVRLAHLIVTFGFADDEENTLDYFVAKNRHGASRFTIKSIPHDFVHGRMFAGQDTASEQGGWSY